MCDKLNHTKVSDQEIALLFGPLQQAMASVFNQKENKLWLTIRFSKDTGNIIAVYAGRKSKVVSLITIYTEQPWLTMQGKTRCW